MKNLFRTGLAAICLATGVLHATDRPVTLVNLPITGSNPLLTSLQAQGFTAVANDGMATTFSGPLVVWESNGTIPDGTVKALGNYVQQGGSLLIGLDRQPGLGAFQLSFLSPTMAWETQIAAEHRGDAYGEIGVGASDPEVFGKMDPKNIALPYYFSIRPFHAVERGVDRYDRFESVNFYVKTPHAPGDYFWNRPLLNRDWTVRLSGNDRAASPLFVTGRYGRGRMAVFASGLDDSSAGLDTVLSPIIQWLTAPLPDLQKEPASGAVQISSSEAIPPSGSDPGHIQVKLKSTSDQPLTVQVLGRVLTWENAAVGDVSQSVPIAAGAEATVDLPLPEPSSQNYQALEAKNAFVVRLGVLSESGATLLAEKVTSADFSPGTGIELSADNLYKVTYPYPGAPDQTTLPTLQRRMGYAISAYAYPPGQTVNATVVFTNGLHNLTPQATITDETTPHNPSVMALNGGGHMEKGPRDGLIAYGTWQGEPKVENVLRFHFPSPVTVGGVSLMGNAISFRQYTWRNPAEVVIEGEGKPLAHATGLDARFVAENGLVYIDFPPVQVTDLRIRLPWTETLADGSHRSAPQLGDTEIMGNNGPLPGAVAGPATLVLRDSMSGTETVVAKKDLSVPPGGRVIWNQPLVLPDSNHSCYYQLEARFAGQAKQIPLLAIKPERTLLSIDQLRPPGAPSMGFIVTRGFRNCFPLGTGTRESGSGWETPDDLVWAYSHLTKQTGAGSKTQANRLYVNNTDFRHYSTPWVNFPNGEKVFHDAAPNLLEGMTKQKNWATSGKVLFGFSDRWDTGPSVSRLYTWPEILDFDAYLRGKGSSGLTGRTIAELGREINQNFAAEWSSFQEQNYLQAVEELRQTFAAVGKDLVISGQGMPLTSNATAASVAQTVEGMSDDNTWGMGNESVPFTTGRQVALLAYNPAWKMNENFVWGYDSAVIGNCFSFAHVVSTTEPSRRQYYDSIWRGLIDPSGTYRAALTYGFGMNGDISCVMSSNDWQQLWQAQERFSLIYPSAPLGAGFILSSAPVDSPTSTLFGGGGMGGGAGDDEIVRVAGVFERLHDSGLSLPFSSNLLALRQWKGTAPLILVDLSQVTDEEVAVLKNLGARGVKTAAFAGNTPLSPAAADLFGVTPDGQSVHATAVGTVDGKSLVANNNFLYIPFRAEAMTLPQTQRLAPLLQQWLALPIVFPPGTMGYGFVSGTQKFVVLEDWMEKGRMAELRVHADGLSAQAIGLNDHQPLTLKRDGDDWLIQVPLRPGDGEVVVLEEQK